MYLVDGIEVIVIDKPKGKNRKKSLVGPLCRDSPTALRVFSLIPRMLTLGSL